MGKESLITVVGYYYSIYSLIYYEGVMIAVNNNKRALRIFLISLSFSLVIFNRFYKNIYS